MAWFSFLRREAAAISATPTPPLLAGRYRIGARLGGGAVGEVYEAVDLRTGASVAVKRIPLAADMPSAERAEWLSRLHREADISHRLEHPDILSVHEAGLTPQEAWLAMERVHGNDLSRYTQPNRLLPETLVLRIGARVGAALAHAHARGIIHRDLKPANVVVDLGTGVLKLIDFGVARVEDAAQTRTGMTLGTPAYMAPEQLAGAPAGPATDTYALGVMLFELLSGRRPHQADTLGELLRSTHRDPPAQLGVLRPDLPSAVVSAVERLLAREPERRPADLADWAAELAALAGVMARVLAPDVALRL